MFSGELKHSINEALAGGTGNTVEQRIHGLLQKNPVMLFMKGQQLLPSKFQVISLRYPIITHIFSSRNHILTFDSGGWTFGFVDVLFSQSHCQIV